MMQTSPNPATLKQLCNHADNVRFMASSVSSTLEVCTMVLDTYRGDQEKVNLVQNVLHLLTDVLQENKHLEGLEVTSRNLSIAVEENAK